MKAKAKLDKDSNKWVVDVLLDDGQTIPVGKIIDKELNIFEVNTWDTKQEAKEWITKFNLHNEITKGR